MFHELDDPIPPELGDGLRRKVRARVRTRRRRQAAIGGAAGAVVLGVGGLYARAASQLTKIERIEIAGSGTGTSTAPSGDAVTEPASVLFVGTDGAQNGLVDGSEPRSGYGLADTIVVSRLDPVAGTVRMLSVPRDLEVTTPDGSATERINSVLQTDGPEGLIDVLQKQLAITIDHVVMVDFTGFREVVERLGGVQIEVLAPLRDTNSGLDLETTGCVRLDASQALALVRSRHVELLVGGQWQPDPSGDLGRMDRQRVFLGAALAEARSSLNDPFVLNDVTSWIADGVTLDSALDVNTLIGLTKSALAVDANQVFSVQLPVTAATRPDGAVMLHATDELADIVAWLNGAEAPAGAPSTTAIPNEPQATGTVDTCVP